VAGGPEGWVRARPPGRLSRRSWCVLSPRRWDTTPGDTAGQPPV